MDFPLLLNHLRNRDIIFFLFQVIPAIKSRCLNIRVPAPSHEDVVRVIQSVAKKEGCNLPTELAQRIAKKSNRNLRCDQSNKD